PEHPTLRTHRVAIGQYDLAGEGLVRRRRVELDVVGERTDVPDLVGERQPDLLLLNDDDLTYAKIRLDNRSVDTLSAHLSRIVDPLARALCWAATWDMVRDAELPTRRFVDLVMAHGPVEDDDANLQRLLGQASVAVEAYGDPDNRRPTRARLAAAARRGLEAAEPGSDRQLIWARARIGAGDTVEDLAWDRGLLDGTVVVEGLVVDTDLRWDLVGVLASHGADDDGALVDAEEKRDPTDIGERRAATARASRPEPEAKAEAWRKLTEESLHLAMVRAVTGGCSQWRQEDLLRPYVEPYFSNLLTWWKERPREVALALIGGLYPGKLIEPATVAATDAALEDESLPAPVRRILLEDKDGVERALRARGADRG
ncbi:MAG: ERAP1-like C-terminal domain-containing protein, partial [Actinomycetota bacterium]|nr:ERAP1-like C-terminal domain-containing protein [Actinomycetota bacterium]